jgi:hypothetical protein
MIIVMTSSSIATVASRIGGPRQLRGLHVTEPGVVRSVEMA